MTDRINDKLADKPLTLADAAGERFDATCVAHGLTPEDVRNVGLSPGGQTLLHGLAKEAGITKKEHDAGFEARVPDIPPLRAAVDTSVFAAAGGTIGAATAALKALATEGRLSWKSFAERAPKSTAIGAVLGGLAGVAALRIVNSERQSLRRAASAQWDEQEAAWAKREAERAATPISAPSLGK